MNEAASDFQRRRAEGNERILEGAPLSIKRFFALDQDVYTPGALTKQTKELLGIVASTVLRCNDCIAYHILEAKEAGVSREELIEALGVALVVGGSSTIPHLRFAVEFLEGEDGAG